MISVTGDKETEANLDKISEGLTSTKMVSGATGYIERGSKKDAPVQSGVLRASITSSVKTYNERVEGVTGSEKVYAKTVEPITIKMSARYYLSKYANKASEVSKWVEKAVRRLLK